MDCLVCGRGIEVAIFKGSGYCSIDCRKKAGLDTSSVGTYMFVASDEKQLIEEIRRGK